MTKAAAVVRRNCMRRTTKQRAREPEVMLIATVSRRMLVRANICFDEWWEIRKVPATGLSSNNTKRTPRRRTVTTVNISRLDKCYSQSIRPSHILIRAKPTTDSPSTGISSTATSSEIRWHRATPRTCRSAAFACKLSQTVFDALAADSDKFYPNRRHTRWPHWWVA